ncbi:MAG: organic solvent tolerance protein OstA [Pirellulales bacterium]|nr:organic solvent tolerance protein OstA [Pirellulales bacterium]
MALLVVLASSISADVALPPSNRTDPITLSAEFAHHWIQGEYEVWVLRGACRIEQGRNLAAGDEAVVWINRAEPDELKCHHLIVYLEGHVTIERENGAHPVRLTDESRLEDFYTIGAVTVQVPQVAGPPEAKPPIYGRGMARRSPEAAGAIRRTQHQQFITDPAMVPIGPPPTGMRRFTIHQRSNVPTEWELRRNDPNSDQWTAVFNYGVNVLVEGVSDMGVLDISADRVVIWTEGLDKFDVSGGQPQSKDIPLEFYLEGNIEFREGGRVIYADRMYYDVRNQVGMILNAEMITPLPKHEGKLRLRTEMLQQLGEDRFVALQTFLTSSRLGKPGYRMQVGDIAFEDIQRPLVNPFTQTPLIDAETGQPAIDHQRLATGHNAFLFLGDVPVFYWPFFAADLQDPSLYIRRIRARKDDIFGTQVLTNWDAYQLFGVQHRPAGTDWDLSLDYLSERGLGHGTTYLYDREGFLTLPGRTVGLLDYWGIQDHGHDNLGWGQRDLTPEKKYRYRLFSQHRQMLPYDWRISTELGWISDRNFLDQYYEREWDDLKDENTGLELRRAVDNVTFSITTDTRINGFFTQTEWYPRADHYQLGQSLFNDAFTWHEHSNIGYARFRILSYPEDPDQQATFTYLPWEENGSTKGERLVTTQEIEWPFQFGPVKTVPYALGQLAHWGEDLSGDDLQRVYYQAGIRASVPIWRINPAIENELFNVHGLAHKIVFDAEFSFAEANRDLDVLPLYDALDDDSIEYFRRRMAALSYGTPQIPYRFDPRSYAIRSGLASWVTSPSAEVVDDLMAMRLGMRQRWQTKRGRPDRRKIIDWVVLDANAVWFPNEERDNFGEALGLADYDFRWHVGDRLTVVSEGIFDFFDDAQQTITIGGFLARPPRGNFYMGMRLIQAPVRSHILSFSYNYWMSPKWVSSFGTSVDLRNNRNIGQRLSIIRIGESLLVGAGFNVDASRGNVGVLISVEPRFLPKMRLSHAGGVSIPVAGVHGLE